MLYTEIEREIDLGEKERGREREETYKTRESEILRRFEKQLEIGEFVTPSVRVSNSVHNKIRFLPF